MGITHRRGNVLVTATATGNKVQINKQKHIFFCQCHLPGFFFSVPGSCLATVLVETFNSTLQELFFLSLNALYCQKTNFDSSLTCFFKKKYCELGSNKQLSVTSQLR